MKLKGLMVAFVAACIFMLSGCYERQLEKTDILTTYFADKQDEKTVLGGGVATVRTFSDSMADNPVSLIFAKGDSLADAEQKLEKSADHPLFFGAVRAVIVGENMAKDGLLEFLKSLESDYKLRSESMFFITKSNPSDIVLHKAVNDFSGGFAAESMLESLEKDGKIVCPNVSDMFEVIYEGKVGIACASVELDEEMMRFSGYGIFNKDRLIFYSNEDETDGINAFINDAATFEYYNNGLKYSLKKIDEKKDVLYKDGGLKFDLDFEFECEISEPYENISNDELLKVEAAFEKILLKKIQAAFDKAVEERCDFLDLYMIYQKKYRYEFENSDYEKLFGEAVSNINVDVVFSEKGNI